MAGYQMSRGKNAIGKDAICGVEEQFVWQVIEKLGLQANAIQMQDAMARGDHREGQTRGQIAPSEAGRSPQTLKVH